MLPKDSPSCLALWVDPGVHCLAHLLGWLYVFIYLFKGKKNICGGYQETCVLRLWLFKKENRLLRACPPLLLRNQGAGGCDLPCSPELFHRQTLERCLSRNETLADLGYEDILAGLLLRLHWHRPWIRHYVQISASSSTLQASLQIENSFLVFNWLKIM